MGVVCYFAAVIWDELSPDIVREGMEILIGVWCLQCVLYMVPTPVSFVHWYDACMQHHLKNERRHVKKIPFASREDQSETPVWHVLQHIILLTVGVYGSKSFVLAVLLLFIIHMWRPIHFARLYEEIIEERTTPERTVVLPRVVQNILIYTDYHVFVNPYKCSMSPWSPFWDTMCGRNPFESRVPWIGSCPFPLVDFFFVDYKSERFLVHYHRRYPPAFLPSATAHSPPSPYTPRLSLENILRRWWPSALTSMVNTEPPFSGVLRKKTTLLSSSSSSLSDHTPDVCLYVIFSHLDYMAHVHFRSCLRHLLKVSLVSSAQSPLVTLDFGRRNHTYGPLPFRISPFLAPQKLEVSNLDVYQSCLQTFLETRVHKNNTNNNLRELCLSKVILCADADVVDCRCVAPSPCPHSPVYVCARRG